MQLSRLRRAPAVERRFREGAPGYRGGMNLSLLLIVIGIILAVLVDYALGIVCILIGLVLLIWPRLRAGV
jgi:hypothetical protein